MLCESHSPNQICTNTCRIDRDSFLLFILTLFAVSLVLSLEIVGFENNWYSLHYSIYKIYRKLIKYSKWLPPLVD